MPHKGGLGKELLIVVNNSNPIVSGEYVHEIEKNMALLYQRIISVLLQKLEMVGQALIMGLCHIG
ncbi:MAG: hypothetical protein HFG39_15655 [Lachnospiraceae bacterium]|nr:hypothetical protein [Lachnospiraceae bacterium]